MRRSARATHLLRVLRRREGDTFDAGLVNGPRGKGTLTAIGPDALTLSFAWDAAPPPLDPITLIIGLPRPQTARDILRDATSLGVAAMHFVTTDKSEPSYGRSTLWTWRRMAPPPHHRRRTGVRHASARGHAWGVRCSRSSVVCPDQAIRVALDHYEARETLSKCRLSDDTAETPPPELALAFGPERGWSNAERAALRGAGFVLAHLGSRVLRTETAVVAAVALVKARLGWM